MTYFVQTFCIAFNWPKLWHWIKRNFVIIFQKIANFQSYCISWIQRYAKWQKKIQLTYNFNLHMRDMNLSVGFCAIVSNCAYMALLSLVLRLIKEKGLKLQKNLEIGYSNRHDVTFSKRGRLKCCTTVHIIIMCSKRPLLEKVAWSRLICPIVPCPSGWITSGLNPRSILTVPTFTCPTIIGRILPKYLSIQFWFAANACRTSVRWA